LRALLVLAVAAVPALAGTISGKVSDTTGAALAGGFWLLVSTTGDGVRPGAGVAAACTERASG
jgi:hypothetical protein